MTESFEIWSINKEWKKAIDKFCEQGKIKMDEKTKSEIYERVEAPKI